ncbi:hypothetical protein PIB30_087233 [Stylosanthes scabra]|uniref:Uncharacterized protein n=1 Tax=Stylosanthes scabra TaxID=79078 RepID=A0ABU6YS73_9FABA|nr:hypothetical protein [Stylosanthes scabra]
MATMRGKRLLSDVEQEESCDNDCRNTGKILVSPDPHGMHNKWFFETAEDLAKGRMATHGIVTSENTKDGFGHANIYLGDGILSDITNVYVVPNETFNARRKRIEKLTARRKVLALPGKYGENLRKLCS